MASDRTSLLAAVLLFSLQGCAPMTPDVQAPPAANPAVVRIAGQLAYRERIALPPSVRVEVLVTDISEGANQELVLARSVRSVENAAPPIPFALNVSQDRISKGPLFGLRAFIYDASGAQLFRTATPFLVNMRTPSLETGTIMLTMTPSGGSGAEGVTGIHNSDWIVERVGSQPTSRTSMPSIKFGLDGRMSGSSGCNLFSSTYTLDGSKLSPGNIALTRRACEAELMEQESRFMMHLNGVVSARIDPTGRLSLRSADGSEIVARRQKQQ